MSNTRERIITAAKEEFLAKGFNHASMRVISRNADMTVSNIYNHYKSKDEIFRTILQPLLLAFDNMLETHNTDEHISERVFNSKSYQQEIIISLIDILTKFRTELKLLLFMASGSSLENFRDRFTNRQTETGVEYIRLMKVKYPYINGNISKFFVHLQSSFWITVLSEIVSHEELTDAELECFLSEYVKYGTAGWKALMGF